MILAPRLGRDGRTNRQTGADVWAVRALRPSAPMVTPLGPAADRPPGLSAAVVGSACRCRWRRWPAEWTQMTVEGLSHRMGTRPATSAAPSQSPARGASQTQILQLILKITFNFANFMGRLNLRYARKLERNRMSFYGF